MKHWVATDRDGSVHAFGCCNKPVRSQGYWFGMGILLNADDISHLPRVPTWEDEAVLEDFDPWQ